MAVNLKIRDQLPSDSIIFDNPSFDNSIIGVSLDDNIIYSLYDMVAEYMEDHNCDEQTALDWIFYNSIGSLPYAGKNAPIVVSLES